MNNAHPYCIQFVTDRECVYDIGDERISTCDIECGRECESSGPKVFYFPCPGEAIVVV